jgi:hypothetical protein
MAVANGFTDAPLHPVTYHRVSHPSSYRNAQSGRLTVVRSYEEDEERMPPGASLIAHALEVGGMAQAMCALHDRAALARSPYTTVNRWRPRSRRRRRTLRPPGFIIRLRKPCSRLRGIRFG